MKPLHRILLTSLASLFASIAAVSAATSTWTNSVDTFWTTAGNWDPGVPGGGDDILFPDVTGQTVDLAAGAYSIGTLTFNAADAYSLGNGTLTLGGDLTQSGAGAVALNSTTDLGGANRNFGGSGSGVVSLNGPVTDTAAAGARVAFTGGNWVIANSANTVDRFTVGSGATVKVTGSVASVPDFPGSWYLGGNGASGGFYGAVDGGTLKIEASQSVSGAYIPTTVTVNSTPDWADRGFVYGPNGGTLIFNTAGVAPMSSPTVWYSQGGTSTLVVGEPLPYGDWLAPNVGAPSDGTNQFRSPFEVEFGVALGIFQNSSYTYSGSTPYYKWRQGSGDFVVILTNGASAYLDWNALTNGNLIIKGQPGGDSSVIETNATGWTRNVGRFAIRGPHRSGIQYTDASGNYPAGAISRSFCIPQYNGNGMVFYDAVQVWNRDGLERLACDMSFESGCSVDFCGGRRQNLLDLGHPGTGAAGTGVAVAGPTNTITIKGGAKLNLNLQMRSNIGDARTSSSGESAGLRVWSNIDIKDGGQLKIYRSQTNGYNIKEIPAGDPGGGANSWCTKAIELYRPVTGEGSSASDARYVVTLPFSPPSNSNKDSGNNNGKDGVNFNAQGNTQIGAYPGAELIVNGSGDYGLRVVGPADCVSNVLANGRSSRVSGTAGTLTIANTDSAPMWIPGGPASTPVYLGLDSETGSTPNYILRPSVGLDGFAGLILKGGTAIVEDSSSVTMKTLRLAGSAAIQLGTAGGGSVLNFANSSAVAWNAGTLSISSWNGSLNGGGSDRIYVGSDATGLTASQLAQIKWISPLGGGDITGARILGTGEIVPLVPPASFTSLQAPAVPSTPFAAVLNGFPGVNYTIYWTPSLASPSWTFLSSGTGTFSLNDPASIGQPMRFYRAVISGP